MLCETVKQTSGHYRNSGLFQLPLEAFIRNAEYKSIRMDEDRHHFLQSYQTTAMIIYYVTWSLVFSFTLLSVSHQSCVTHYRSLFAQFYFPTN
jgi:hypothetical protein